MATTSVEYILNPINFIIYFILNLDFITNKERNYAYFFINLIIGVVISFFSFVFNELLILFFCDLDKDTYLQISRRSSSDENYIDFEDVNIGVDDKEKIPADFFKKQFLNHDYKLKHGESFDEVRSRALKGLAKVMKRNLGKSALIVTHSSTITFLLSKWCDVEYNGKYIIRYKNNTIINGFTTPDLIELKFNDKNKLESIRRVVISNKENKKKTNKKGKK